MSDIRSMHEFFKSDKGANIKSLLQRHDIKGLSQLRPVFVANNPYMFKYVFFMPEESKDISLPDFDLLFYLLDHGLEIRDNLELLPALITYAKDIDIVMISNLIDRGAPVSLDDLDGRSSMKFCVIPNTSCLTAAALVRDVDLLEYFLVQFPGNIYDTFMDLQKYSSIEDDHCVCESDNSELLWKSADRLSWFLHHLTEKSLIILQLLLSSIK